MQTEQQIQIEQNPCYECYIVEAGIAITAAIVATAVGVYIRRKIVKRKEKTDA